ncbi:MAG: AAA family ATPase [Bacteroidia bacterium]|nr:AAA family ATPase [Bacteroidia bacterium]
MNEYHSFEKQVFDWLMAKHVKDPSFTFSVRQSASKGAQADYFIGTEKSKYIDMTFWTVPINYPGSSSDLIDLVIKIKGDGYSYYIQFNQTRKPHNEQNRMVLELIRNIKSKLRNFRGFYENGPDNKMEYFHVGDAKKVYSDVDKMLAEVEIDLYNLIPIVDKEFESFVKKNPSFVGHRISLDEFNSMIEKMHQRIAKHTPDVITIPDPKEDVDTKIVEPIISHPLNVIFYGPPGTGKTYSTLIRAAEILLKRSVVDYNEALRVFNENLGDRIEFITFHQNYSYEDFIQGLRPDTDNSDQLVFDKKDGVFKRIADRALRNIVAATNPLHAKLEFEEAFAQFIRPFVEGEKERIEVRMKSSYYHITAISEKTIKFEKASGSTIHTLSITTLKRMYEAESTLKIQGLTPYYEPLLKELLKIGQSLVNKKDKVEKNNYVIIIDEINRANISRVFGELITLIEVEKRSHGAIPLTTTLPSGDPFIVPSNLYIIGTMNTADKSIALLDIALRRRFEFEAMYPLYEINGKEIYDVDILHKLNERIVSSKGHDFQIGHSYFMEENSDLICRMNKKVIPLMLEYFMNDEKEVKDILGFAGLDLEENSWPIRIKGRK